MDKLVYHQLFTNLFNKVVPLSKIVTVTILAECIIIYIYWDILNQNVGHMSDKIELSFEEKI